MPAGTKSDTRLGMPQPRFTQSPSRNSSAARAATCSRVSLAFDDIVDAFHLHDAVNEDEGSDDGFGIERADGDDFLDLDDGCTCRDGHNRIEISRRFPVDEIAQLVRLPRFDERELRGERLVENGAAPVEDALLAPFGHLGARADGAVEPGDAGARGPDALAEDSLRDELERDFAG